MEGPSSPIHHDNSPATSNTGPHDSATSSFVGPTPTSSPPKTISHLQTAPPLINNSPPLTLHTHQPTPISWASLLKENRMMGKGDSLKHVEVTRGSKVVFTHEQAFTIECAWGICLIAYVMGRPPSLEVFNELRASWKVPHKYMPHKSGWIVFRFESHVDRERVLVNGPYATNGAPWLLKKIPYDFNFNDECFNSIPTWVKFPKLPMILWTNEALSILGSHLGIPIQTDQFTSKRNMADYARILVEVDTTLPLLREIEIALPSGREITQSIVYEVEPIICPKCHTLGHQREECNAIRNKARARARSRSRARQTQVNPDVLRNDHQVIACKEDAMAHREVPQHDPVSEDVQDDRPNDYQEVWRRKEKAKVQDEGPKNGQQSATPVLTAVVQPMTAVNTHTTAVESRQKIRSSPITAVSAQTTAVMRTQRRLTAVSPPKTAVKARQKLHFTETTAVLPPITAVFNGPMGQITKDVPPTENNVATGDVPSSSGMEPYPVELHECIKGTWGETLEEYLAKRGDDEGAFSPPEEIPIPPTTKAKAKGKNLGKSHADVVVKGKGQGKKGTGSKHPK